MNTKSTENKPADKTETIIIVGSGPAAHTAAIYTARAQLSPLVFEGFMAGGIAAGGQLTTTSVVENFPGFPEGIDGPELMLRMRAQSEKFGARILTETVESVDFSKPGNFIVRAASGEYAARAVILATGATAKRLGVAGEELFWDKGISACAVCDGALPIFRNKPLIVIGGGDTACEEAHFLTRFAEKVYMAVRRDELRASKPMQRLVLSHPKIEVMWNTTAIEAKGDSVLREVVLQDTKNSQTRSMTVSGLFYAIGHTPNTAFLQGAGITTDAAGYIVTEGGSARTVVAGVFACGDVKDPKYRQAITAAGSGCMAAIEAEHYLSQ